MPPYVRKLLGALFDVKPVDDSGVVDFGKIDSIEPVIDLSSFRHKKVSDEGELPVKKLAKQDELPPAAAEEIEPESYEPASPEDNFEDLLNSEIDLEVELAKFGGRPVSQNFAKPRYKVIKRQEIVYAPDPKPETSLDPKLKSVLAEIRRQNIVVRDAPAPEINFERPSVADVVTISREPILSPRKSKRIKFKIPIKYLLIGTGVILALIAISQYGIRFKQKVIQNSASALENLQSAHNDLKSMNFQDANHDFLKAYQNFSKAGDNLNFMGAAITDLIAQLPGAGTVKSAKDLIEVGQLLSDAGSSMTNAMDAVSKTGIILNPTSNNVAIGKVIGALKKALLVSNSDVTKAKDLLSEIDESIIPEDKKESFDDFKSKLPLFVEAIGKSSDYAKFFENLIDVSGSKRYLILFENSSELRPTGGFPGSYAVVSFKDGKMDDFFVDDVYNIDGQIKESIIPPLQMQHITPTWGMRDANWFIDFPTSAHKIEEFYKKETGNSIDGVVAVNPKLVAEVLDVVGTVNMPEYNLSLDSKNILTTIQDQVEYGANRTQPKQVIKDFAPLLLHKIYTAKSEQWLQIFNNMVAAMDQKQVLMYFNNLSLESFATDNGFGGQVRQVAGDYLMPTITNVKGSKTDAVTDTSFAIMTKFENDSAVHTLVIKRQHKGGHEKFGFYNKPNPAYVRVLVPDGAELVSLEGNDNPNYTPLMNYNKSDFTRDDDLNKFETSGLVDSSNGVTTYRETGKSEFGFWLIVDPGSSKTVTLTYRVPRALDNGSYQLYVQKQPGLEVKNFVFSLQKQDNLIPVESYPALADQGGSYEYSASPLDGDMQFKVNFK